MPQMNMQNMLGMTPEQMEIARKTRYAETLRRQSEEPMQGQMVSGHYVAPSWTQGLAKMLSAYGSGKMERDAAESAKAYGEQQKTDFTDTAAKYVAALRGTPEQQTPYQADNPFGEDLGNLQTVTPGTPGDPNQALAIAMQSRSPQWQQFGMQQTMEQAMPAKPMVVGRSLIDPRSGQVVATDSTWQAEQQATRAQKIEELNMRLEDQRLNREQQAELRRELAGQQEAMRRDLAAQASADRRMIAAQSSADRRVQTAQGNKPPAGYRWTPEGNLEMIPGGPADLKQQAQLEGGGTVDALVTNLRDIYNQLDEKGGITSTNNRWGSNLVAGIKSSETGQAVGRKFGTENQSLRNSIAQERPRLLHAIMKATGMSARQLDSNAELKLYLSTATDPTLDVQANRRALDMIEKLYGSGAGNAPIAPDGGSPGGKVKRFNPATGRIE